MQSNAKAQLQKLKYVLGADNMALLSTYIVFARGRWLALAEAWPELKSWFDEADTGLKARIEAFVGDLAAAVRRLKALIVDEGKAYDEAVAESGLKALITGSYKYLQPQFKSGASGNELACVQLLCADNAVIAVWLAQIAEATAMTVAYAKLSNTGLDKLDAGIDSVALCMTEVVNKAYACTVKASDEPLLVSINIATAGGDDYVSELMSTVLKASACAAFGSESTIGKIREALRDAGGDPNTAAKDLPFPIQLGIDYAEGRFGSREHADVDCACAMCTGIHDREQAKKGKT